MIKRYCVIKDTVAIVADGASTNEQFYADALSAGLSNEQVEILTQEQYDARKALEPQPEPQLSEIEKLRLEQAQANSELVQLIMMLGGA